MTIEDHSYVNWRITATILLTMTHRKNSHPQGSTKHGLIAIITKVNGEEITALMQTMVNLLMKCHLLVSMPQLHV